MQSNKAFGTRHLVRIAIVASLVGAAWLPAAFAAPAVNDVVDQAQAPAQAQAMESWRSDMARVETPTEGCFQASYPSILWKQVNCTVVQPLVHPLPRRVNKTAGASQTTGNGNDYAIKVSGLISSAVGTFPTVTGVTSEKSVGVAAFGGGGILGPNEYTLQANSNYTGTTAACKNHSGCTIWQQFIYSPDYQTKDALIYSSPQAS